MDEAEAQNALNEFEIRMLAGEETEARAALRLFLFELVGAPAEGSLGEAAQMLANLPQPPRAAASVLLRAIARTGFLNDNTTNQIARSVVSIAEKGLPGLVNILGLNPKNQTYEKFNVLRGAKAWVDNQLAPMRVPYTTLQSMLAARKTIMNALAHGRLNEFGGPYHISEMKDAIESVFMHIDNVSKIDSTLAADVETSEISIDDAIHLTKIYPSFIADDNFRPFLNCASSCLYEFIDSLRGRFTASVVQDWAGNYLPKRYPLMDAGRDLRILVPFDSEGRGAATDLRINVSSDSQEILFCSEHIALGSVSPGKFSVSLDVSVVDPTAEVSAILEIEWGEVGTSRRQSALFELKVLAQAAGIDWECYAYADPYGTAPAQGDSFVGRQEQVQTLVARMLRKPMEPSYITGQKRVGKTSLATAAAEQARLRDPKCRLSWHYILWGQIAHEDPRVCLRQLGEEIEDFLVGELPGNALLQKGSYDGSLSPLIKLSKTAKIADPDRRFVIIIDEFDEMPQDLYLQGNLADTVFGNIRAITTTSNICLLLVGGENMPFVMDRQGQKLNKFSRVNLTYFDRATEWDDYVRLVREPSTGFLEWHSDAIAEVYDLTNGNPYFSKIICSKVFARALRERDVDVTREEVREAINVEISRLDDNLFAHLWQDGIFAPVEEREFVVLKRKRVLAALARCIRANQQPTRVHIYAQKSTADLTEAELIRVLADFVSRDVIVEKDGVYRPVLPIFELWLVDVGLTRLAADALSQDLAAEAQRIEDEARVLSEELVALTSRWPTYRGRHLGPDDVRSWLSQVPSSRDQRALFTILKATRFVSEGEVLERIRNARLVVLGLTDVAIRRKNNERRNDIVITYVDGEGKSGQKYTSLYAEENFVSTSAILPPANFSSAYRQHVERHGVPKAIVIIDDIVGTGKSLASNMKRFHDENLDLLTIDRPNVLAFALLATAEGQQTMLNELSKLEYDRIDFRAGEILDQSASLFSETNGVFPTVEDRDRAKALATDIGYKIYRKAPLGFGGKGLCVVFPTTVPNNSLPLLHSRGKGPAPQWRPLFERFVN